jgi:hypothetical protein
VKRTYPEFVAPFVCFDGDVKPAGIGIEPKERQMLLTVRYSSSALNAPCQVAEMMRQDVMV